MLKPPEARVPFVGKRPLDDAHRKSTYQYLSLTGKDRVDLSLHQAKGREDWKGTYWLTAHNLRGDHQPIRLNIEEVRCLRDACEVVLADHAVTNGTNNH